MPVEFTRRASYQVFHNVDAHYNQYRVGDRMILGHWSTIDVPWDAENDLVLGRIFSRHNADDRPDGQDAPSLSVGDLISLWRDPDQGTKWFAVQRHGFIRVAPPREVHLPPYRQRIKTLRQRPVPTFR